jgi:hypothetical protein
MVAITDSAWNSSDGALVADAVALLVGPAGGVADVGVDVPRVALVDAPGAALGADAPEHAVTAASDIAANTVHLPVRMTTASVHRLVTAMSIRWLAAVVVRWLAAVRAQV